MSDTLILESTYNNVLVTGSSSIIGQPVSQALTTAGYQVTEVSRHSTAPAAISWDMVTGEGNELIAKKMADLDRFCLVHCAPIWFLPQQIAWLIELGLRRVIVFSSSSIDGKRGSNSLHEQQLVKLLETAENEVVMACEAAGVQLTIFRPTMIYGYGQGENLAFIAKIIQRFKCFPVANPAMGLRQPVHADDLAKAVIQAIDNVNTYGKKYTLAGAEALPYKEIVRRIFIAIGCTPRVIAINGMVYRLALSILASVAKLLGQSLPIDPAMADRMQQDLSFDYSEAAADFGYAPDLFLPNGANDLLERPSQRSRQA